MSELPDIGAEYATVLARVDGDVAIFGEIISAFLIEYPSRLEHLQEALQSGDRAAVAFHAHALLGALRVLDDGSNVALVQRLEALARSGDLVGTGNLYAKLVAELEVLRLRLVAWSARLNGCAPGSPAGSANAMVLAAAARPPRCSSDSSD